MKFAKRWMIDKFTLKKDEEDGEEYLVDKNGDDISEHQITQEDIWDKLTLMSMMDLLKAHEVAAAQAIMQHNQTKASIRHFVALHLGIDLAKEWRLTKDYLDKKTTKECLDLIDRLGISTDEKALAYLQETLNKKRGKFNTCKKAELISLIIESGVDLAGKVPDEILNAAKALEKTMDEE
jgi:putative heme degradation protein